MSSRGSDKIGLDAKGRWGRWGEQGVGTGTIGRGGGDSRNGKPKNNPKKGPVCNVHVREPAEIQDAGVPPLKIYFISTTFKTNPNKENQQIIHAI